MIRFHGRLYLFYSGNGYGSREVRDRLRDLQDGHRAVQAGQPAARHAGRTSPGPGGATPFVDRAGHAAAGLPRLAHRQRRLPGDDPACTTAKGCRPAADVRRHLGRVGKRGRLGVPRGTERPPRTPLALAGDLPDPLRRRRARARGAQRAPGAARAGGSRRASASTGVPDEWLALTVPGQFQTRYYTVRSLADGVLSLDVVVHERGPGHRVGADRLRRRRVGLSAPEGLLRAAGRRRLGGAGR